MGEELEGADLRNRNLKLLTQMKYLRSQNDTQNKLGRSQGLRCDLQLLEYRQHLKSQN